MGNLFYGLLNGLGYLHPVHPILVHLTIGTIIAALVFGLLGWIFNKPMSYTVARYNANLALISYFLTVPTGLIDWQHFYGGTTQGSIGFDIIMKIIVASSLLVFLIATFLINRRVKAGSKIPLIFYALNLVHAVLLGFYGASIVY